MRLASLHAQHGMLCAAMPVGLRLLSCRLSLTTSSSEKMSANGTAVFSRHLVGPMRSLGIWFCQRSHRPLLLLAGQVTTATILDHRLIPHRFHLRDPHYNTYVSNQKHVMYCRLTRCSAHMAWHSCPAPASEYPDTCHNSCARSVCIVLACSHIEMCRCP